MTLLVLREVALWGQKIWMCIVVGNEVDATALMLWCLRQICCLINV